MRVTMLGNLQANGDDDDDDDGRNSVLSMWNAGEADAANASSSPSLYKSV